MKILTTILFILIFISCKKIELKENFENSPINNFDIFWSEFDKFYPYFELKKVDWDSIYKKYRPQISENTSSAQLFEIFKKISLSLKDGHVNIFTNLGTIQYTGWFDQYNQNSLDRKIFLKKYLISYSSKDVFDYGYLANEIAYIAIRSFDGEDKIFEFIDDILIHLNNPKGIIIDIRNNSGGYNSNAAIVSGRFTNEVKLGYKTRYRNGLGHNDFSDWFEYKNRPLGSTKYLGKIAILTNRSCFSAAEDFLMLMQTNPKCKFVGDTTGGGSGNPVFRELPNGWFFRLSTWQSIDMNGFFCEGRGIYPHIPKQMNYKDIKLANDKILQAAISFINVL